MDNLLGDIIGVGMTLAFAVILYPLKDVILHPFPKNKK